MNTIEQKMKEEFEFQAIDRFKACDLDNLLKVILVNWNIRCNLHTISNNCA